MTKGTGASAQKAQREGGGTGSKITGRDASTSSGGASTGRVTKRGGSGRKVEKASEKPKQFQVMTDKAIIEDSKGENKTRAVGDKVSLTPSRAQQLREGGIALADVD